MAPCFVWRLTTVTMLCRSGMKNKKTQAWATVSSSKRHRASPSESSSSTVHPPTPHCTVVPVSPVSWHEWYAAVCVWIWPVSCPRHIPLFLFGEIHQKEWQWSACHEPRPKGASYLGPPCNIQLQFVTRALLARLLFYFFFFFFLFFWPLTST